MNYKTLKEKEITCPAIPSMFIVKSEDVKKAVLEFEKDIDKLKQDYKDIGEFNDYISRVIEDSKILHRRHFGDWREKITSFEKDWDSPTDEVWDSIEEKKE